MLIIPREQFLRNVFGISEMFIDAQYSFIIALITETAHWMLS